MKNTFATTILIFYFLAGLSQEAISYEKVIYTDSVGKNVIFSTIDDWFAKKYNSSYDEILLADKDAAKFVVKARMKYTGSMMYSCYGGSIDYTISIRIKDNRYKAVLSNFIHKPENDACGLGILTNSAVYATRGSNKDEQNKMWVKFKAKVAEEVDLIFKSLEEATSNMRVE